MNEISAPPSASSRVPHRAAPFRASRVVGALVRLVPAAILWAVAATAAAQATPAFPSKPVRIVVPFAAGGPTDLVARAVAAGLQQNLGQPVIVENRTGAAGIVGAEYVVKAPADGHTVLLSNVGDTMSMSLYKKLPYAFDRDFAPVTMMVSTPFLVVVHPSLPAKTMQEFLQLARDKPGTLAFGSAGTGVSSHLAGEFLKQAANINVIHVPYKGQAPAMNDVLGEQIAFMFANPVSVLPHVKAGKLRALAVTGPQRLPFNPDIPTVAESGVPGFEADTWFGISAPAGTPEPIVKKLSDEIARVLKGKELKESFEAQGAIVIGNTPAEFARQIQADIVKWRKVITTANITIN